MSKDNKANMQNLEIAQTNMISQQIRTCDVDNENILTVLHDTPRDQFVPEAYKSVAYGDMNIPLDHDQVMMTPMQEAKMLQALAIKSSDTILEVGTGSGYVTALLAKLGKYVTSVDYYQSFTKNAREQLKKLDIDNVDCVTADVACGWEEHGPYDVIAITGSLPRLPESWLRHLSEENGRLFVIEGIAPTMQAKLFQRIGKEKWDETILFETQLPPLINAIKPEIFEF